MNRLNALGKAAAVLDALQTERRLTRIAAAAGLAVSTTHRILVELEKLGWVEHVDHGRWGLAEGAPRRTRQAREQVVRIVGDALAAWCAGMGWQSVWVQRLRPHGAAREVLAALERHGYLTRGQT